MPQGLRATYPGHEGYQRRTAGFVLAGGQSSRMGRDKALLQVGGEPLLTRIARLVLEAAGSVVLIGDPQRYGGFGFPVIADRIEGLGPVGGLLTALENTAATWNLVVACDMPAVTAPVLEDLLLHTETAVDARCIAPVSGGALQPLCAVYHRACLPVVLDAIAGNRLRMTDLLGNLEALAIHAGNSQAFENINTPAQWATWRQAHNS